MSNEGLKTIGLGPEYWEVPSRRDMDRESRSLIFNEIKKDPYFLHKVFRQQLIEIAEKFDDLDHDFSGGTELQDACYKARELARSMEIPDLKERPDAE